MKKVVTNIMLLHATPAIVDKVLEGFAQDAYAQEYMDFEVLGDGEKLEIRVVNNVHFDVMFQSIGEVSFGLWANDPENDKWQFETHFTSTVESVLMHELRNLGRKLRRKVFSRPKK